MSEDCLQQGWEVDLAFSVDPDIVTDSISVKGQAGIIDLRTGCQYVNGVEEEAQGVMHGGAKDEMVRTLLHLWTIISVKG